MQSIYKIKWGNFLETTYLHGTSLLHTNDQVIYRNHRQSPGGVIHTWHSQLSFYDNSYTTSLPILTPGKRYFFHINLVQSPKNSINMAITYYNIDNDKIKQVFYEDLDGYFTYPLGATSYQIELFNLNNRKLEFQDLWISSKNIKQKFQISFHKFNDQDEMVLLQNEEFAKWSITLVADSVDTTTFPVRDGENNIFLSLGEKGLQEDDLPEIMQLLQAQKIKPGTQLVVRSYGAHKMLQEAKKLFQQKFSQTGLE